MYFFQNPIHTNKEGVEPKCPPCPVNITTLVKLSPNIVNHITVSWNADFWKAEYGRGYVITVHLVNKFSSSELLRKLKINGPR